MPDFSLEKNITQNHFKAALIPPLLAGVDEAGCGPWAGPVVAGAVIFSYFDQVPQDLLSILDDSKKMTEKKVVGLGEMKLKLLTGASFKLKVIKKEGQFNRDELITVMHFIQ